MSLQSFMEKKGLPSSSNRPKFIANPNVPAFNIREPQEKIYENAKRGIVKGVGSSLRWIGSQLMKPVETVAAITEQVGKQIGGEQGALKQIPSKIGQVWTGKTERSFTDIWRENLIPLIQKKNAETTMDYFIPELTATMLGTIFDIAADPLNLVMGTGLGKKGLEALSTLDKMAATKVPLYKGAKALFSTKTGNKAFDTLIDEARSLGEFRKAGFLEQARDLQKVTSEFTPEEITALSEYIEKGVQTTPKITEVAEKVKSAYAEMKAIEKEAGIKGGTLEGYLPHLKPQLPLGEKLKQFLYPSRQWTTKLGGAEKGRRIQKFVSETGEEIVGKASMLGLKEIEGIKGLTHEITVGEFKGLKEIQDTLAKYGFELRFKPQATLRGSAWGYFDPEKKQIVIAAKRPTVENVVSTLKHEVLHTSHFQLAGNIEMLETFTGRGIGSELGKALNSAKWAARKEWEAILQSRGIRFEAQTPRMKTYYRKPTELLARAVQAYLDNPAQAMRDMPLTTARIKELQQTNKLFNLLDTTVTPEGMILKGDLYKDAAGKIYQSQLASIKDVETAFGKEFFEKNPAIQLAYRGMAHAKAVTSAEFFSGVKKFAIDKGMPTAVKELKGLQFEPEIAKAIDTYYKGIQPEELKLIFKTYDAVLNWWKGQALIAPSYHIRNFVSNLWNNYLAGVTNPIDYIQAGQLQMGRGAGLKIAGMTPEEIITLARKRGVINAGWFAADIPTAVEQGLKSGWKTGINPLSQENYAFRLNKQMGSIVENNSRLAHFISQLKKGKTIDESVMSVKKYLFDYQDLTNFEKNVMKRGMPFYTWTRKNIPLQLEHLISEPGKFAGLEKVVRAVEAMSMGDANPANEKYLSDYIKNNTSMRVKYNEEDNTYYYFLLGNWMPSYQAMDFLQQPLPSLMGMVTPLLKTPMELLMNKSSFFKNSLGEQELLENYPGETVNFLGLSMPKKTALVLRNLRLLNEFDKLNPGKIFGGKIGEKSVFAGAGLPAVNLPLAGTISPATYKYGRYTVAPTTGERVAGSLLGKLQSYKVSQSRDFYQQDTENRVTEFKQAIKAAQKKGDSERARLLNKQMREFIKSRGR